MALSSHQPPPTTVDQDHRGISAIHPDIIQTHILTRLDGPTLASAACTSSQLHSLASDHHLWSNICHSTWPSTTSPRLRHLVSSFPDGAFSFFSDSFPLLANLDSSSTTADQHHQDRPSELISAVDIHHGEKLIFSKAVETETLTGWFMCSPFRVDLLDPKEVVPTSVNYPEADTCRDVGEKLRLSWILIDPVGRRAMNLSSHTAVSVQRHWLSGEVHARFASILGGGERGTASEHVQCGVVVTLGVGAEGGELQVREVSLEVEDMDGMHLNGKESLVILQRGLEGRKGRKGRRREEEGRRRYEEYLERKRDRKEKKMRTEGTLDTLCVTFGVLGFCLFWLFILEKSKIQICKTYRPCKTTKLSPLLSTCFSLPPHFSRSVKLTDLYRRHVRLSCADELRDTFFFHSLTLSTSIFFFFFFENTLSTSILLC